MAPGALAGLAAAMATGPFSCVDTPKKRYQQLLSRTTQPALHAAHSERLEAIMADMSRLTLYHQPQELDLARQRDERAREMAAVASAMAEAARRIPDVLDEVRMGGEHRELFVGLADTLHDQARQLERLATGRQIMEMEAMLHEINRTCAACHQAFRVLPVVTTRSSS